jgi:hypothetical protein
MDQPSGADVVDFNETISSPDKDFVEKCWQRTDLTRENCLRIASGRRRGWQNCSIVFVRVGFPDLYSFFSTTHDPRPKHQYLSNLLRMSIGQIQFSNQSPALEYPHASRSLRLRSAPSDKDSIAVCVCGGDRTWALWTTEENEVKTSAQVVRLQGIANGRGDLEGRLSQRDRSEGDIRRRYQT